MMSAGREKGSQEFLRNGNDPDQSTRCGRGFSCPYPPRFVAFRMSRFPGVSGDTLPGPNTRAPVEVSIASSGSLHAFLLCFLLLCFGTG